VEGFSIENNLFLLGSSDIFGHVLVTAGFKLNHSAQDFQSKTSNQAVPHHFKHLYINPSLSLIYLGLFSVCTDAHAERE